MLIKTLFKDSKISYSNFLQEKQHHVHCLTEGKDSIDIEFFKRSISRHYQHAYATKKWHNWIYRFIFFGLGLLFLALGIIIFCKTVNFAAGFFFKNTALVKHSINSLCLLLAAGAFAVGYKIHPEKEAVQFLIGKVERELTHPPKHLQIEFNAIISNLPQGSVAPHQTTWIKKALNPLQ